MDDLELHYLKDIFSRSVGQARRAMVRFPQPNYVLIKVAEEAGEVVKAGVHLAEGRDFSHVDLENEVVDTIAMMFRVLIEGDQVIGLPSAFKKSGIHPTNQDTTMQAFITVTNYGDEHQLEKLAERISVHSPAAVYADRVLVVLPTDQLGAFVQALANDPELNWVEYTLQFQH